MIRWIFIFGFEWSDKILNLLYRDCLFLIDSKNFHSFSKIIKTNKMSPKLPTIVRKGNINFNNKYHFFSFIALIFFILTNLIQFIFPFSLNFFSPLDSLKHPSWFFSLPLRFFPFLLILLSSLPRPFLLWPT